MMKLEIGNKGISLLSASPTPQVSSFKFQVSNAAFTLLELLVTVAIIGIIAGMLLTALAKARESAWRARTRDTVYQVVTAWKSYLNDYRQFPTDASGNCIEITQMDTNAMAILGTTNSIYNNNRYIYMEFTKKEWADGFCDKWGELYQVALDNGKGGDVTKYDGEVTPYPGVTIGKSVVAWSKGPDRADDTTETQRDDVKSW